MEVHKKGKRKVLFIIVATPSSEAEKAVGRGISFFPLGPLYIAAYCKKYVKNYECDFSILDLYLENMNEDEMNSIIVNRVKEYQPDIVGFSIMFNTDSLYAMNFAKSIKSLDSNIFTIAGGVCVSDIYSEILKHGTSIDALCYSEGEIPLCDLLDSNDFHETVRQHKSWITEESYNSGKLPVSDFIDNLDEIPPLDYDLIELNRYNIITTEREETDASNENCIPHTFLMQTSRGCPYNCIFCSAAYRSGKKVRIFSAERIISDMRQIKDKYNVKRIDFRDDQALINRERILTILKAAYEMGINISCSNGLTVSLIDDEIAYWLKKVNCTIANLAIESGSERMLKEIIQKPIRLSQVREVVKILRSHGIFSLANFIFGIPGETEEDRQLTEEFIREVRFDWISVFCAMPLKGSRLYDICIENGYCEPVNIFEKRTFQSSVIRTPELDPEETKKYAYYINLRYNFIENPDYADGNYELAKKHFLRVSKLFPFHAISHYCLARTYEKLGDSENTDKYMKMYKDIINSDNEWRNHALQFNLPI